MSKKAFHFRGGSRPLVLAALLANGILHYSQPVMAQTAANQEISNTATATYDDEDTTTPPYTATSNTVTLRVREVAGIEITAQPPSNLSPNAGDIIFVDFVVENTGNDPTKFFIPNSATLRDSSGALTNKFVLAGPIQVVGVDFDNNGTNDLATPVNVPTTGTGAATDALFSGVNGGSINPDGTVTIRVPIRVTGTALQNDTLTVSLGTTDPVDQDNLLRVNDPTDIYTVDNTGTANGDITGDPGNGVREAMDTSATITVAARLQAFAKVLKATASYTPGALDQPNDDKLTYALGLQVDDTTSVPGLAAADLYGTTLNVTGGGGAGSAYVLVSDAIPSGTILDPTVVPTTPTAGATAGRWQVVYTTTPLTTTAQNAAWTTTRPASGITRVGFIYNTTAEGPIVKGSSIGGFSFGVQMSPTFTGGTIANISQLFGQSQPGTPVSGTSTQLVYDESGDQSVNNTLSGVDPGTRTDAGGGINNGVTSPAKDGTDPGTGTNPLAATTNQGQDPANGGAGTDAVGGESTVQVILAAPLNGPQDAPEATGPDGTTATDFTNKSISPPANKDPNATLTDAETPPITFQNTTSHGSEDNQDLRIAFNTPDNLPEGTTVRIDANNDGTFETVYRVVGGVLVKQSGPDPIIPNVPRNTEVTYQVQVNLPGGVNQNEGFDVPVVVFIDNGDGVYNPATDPHNVTTDRVYTGYLKLTKAARILSSTGAILADYGATDDEKNAVALPGNIIEYRITYENISTPLGGGTGSVILNANNLVITEDGTVAPNNWFAVTTSTGTPADSNGGTVNLNPASGNVRVYTDTVTRVVPGAAESPAVTGSFGTFTFRRQIN